MAALKEDLGAAADDFGNTPEFPIVSVVAALLRRDFRVVFLVVFLDFGIIPPNCSTASGCIPPN